MPVARNKGADDDVFALWNQTPRLRRRTPMLALLLNHSPLFVAGEIALGLSLALFIGALINAVGTERLRGEL